MRRTMIDTADRIRPHDRIQAPNGKWMLVSDITYATNDGPLGALAVLLVDPATSGTYGARLMILGSGYTLEIQRDTNRSQRPYTADENTKIRRRGLGYEVWDTISLVWVYIVPGEWKHDLGDAREADTATLNRLMEATAMADPEVQRVVTALRGSIYRGTAERVLNTTPGVIDKAIEMGVVRLVRVQSTTYNRRGERMLAAA